MFQGPKGLKRKYVKYTCSMETVQQNGRFTLFSSNFHSNVYSILYGINFLKVRKFFSFNKVKLACTHKYIHKICTMVVINPVFFTE